jgi:HK97 family phage portal protein
VKFPARIKAAMTALRGQPLDGYPFAAVSQDPWQFWQRGIDRGYKGGGSVAAVESALDGHVHAVAPLPGMHYRRKDDGGKERIKTSSLSRVLRNPNGYQTMSDFLTFLVRQLLGSGNFYAVATRNARYEIDSIHPIYANEVSPVVDRDTGGVFYAVRSSPLAPWSDSTHIIPARDVLHIKLYTPRHPLEGVSPITYAAMSIAANSAISGHQAAFFNNMARPSFILSTEMNLTAVQMKQLRDAWDAQSRMMESGGVPILGGGMKAQQLALNSQDAQLVEAFKMTVEDIARAFRIPGQLLGLPGTYSNTEQLISFWLSTGLGFLINHIELAFDKFFELPADEFTEFDTDTLLRVDLKSRLDALSTATQNGIMSPNEARSRLELPKVEFGDEPRMQAQCVPLSSAKLVPAAPSAPAAPVESVDQEPADLKPEDEKSIDTELVDILLADALRKMKETA